MAGVEGVRWEEKEMTQQARQGSGTAPENCADSGLIPIS